MKVPRKASIPEEKRRGESGAAAAAEPSLFYNSTRQNLLLPTLEVIFFDHLASGQVLLHKVITGDQQC